MKNIKQILLFGIILTIILISCGKSGGDKYLGTWRETGKSNELFIYKAEGKTSFYVKITYKDGDGRSVVYSASYQDDGNLIIGEGHICSYSNDKLNFEGEEYEKVK